jgi:hypothetical protein
LFDVWRENTPAQEAVAAIRQTHPWVDGLLAPAVDLVYGNHDRARRWKAPTSPSSL